MNIYEIKLEFLDEQFMEEVNKMQDEFKIGKSCVFYFLVFEFKKKIIYYLSVLVEKF